MQEQSIETALIFTVQNGVGTIQDQLLLFKQNEISLSFIESRPSNSNTDCLDVIVKFTADASVREKVVNDFKERGIEAKTFAFNKDSKQVKYPQHVTELDDCWNDTMNLPGGNLGQDHPGLRDEEYQRRRQMIVEAAKNHKQNEPIPLIEYTDDEHKTWQSIYQELVKLYPTHACKEHNNNLKILQENGIYTPDRIPQLRDVSEFLHRTTGFRVRPVVGLIKMRTFLAGLAFRVFPATQYIRHSSNPMFSPEPDICHELLGHVPMLLDPTYAQFAHELGLASLGASDAWIRTLGRCFWHTIEVGLCKQDGKLKVYGATILSSFGELQHCLGDDIETKMLDHAEIAKHKPVIDKFQPCYYVAESFQSARKDLKTYCQLTPRSLILRYNPRTESIDELNDPSSLLVLANEIRDDLDYLYKGIEGIRQKAEPK